ncbi:MAG: PAS domain-containing protein, partial [Rhizobiales bacterium]|nr:PAS domain-containing protein [Rhizobacter sp.]
LVPITRHGRREDVYWTYSCSPIDGGAAGGGIGGALVVCTETTQHIVERASLRESEARFRAALKAGRMGSWETDHVTQTRRWSAEGMALFGLDLPGGIGHMGGENDEYVAALHPEDRHLAEHFRQLAARQDSFPAEYRIVRPDGSTLWLSGRGLVVEREPGGEPRRLVSIMADASERKLADEQLRLERERLRLALGAGQMGAYDLNVKDDTLWWSPETYALFGVSPVDFVPSRQSVSEFIHPDDRETFLQARAQAIDERRPFLHEFRIRRADGVVAWLAHRGQAEYDAQGHPVRTFGVTMDVTERKQVDQILRDADQHKDHLIAVLAHELRNPLAPIRNATHILRQTGLTAALATWCHDVIDRQVGQMARLLDDLLDVSRLSGGQLRLQRQPIRLAVAVDRAVEIAQPLIDAAGHAFSISMAPRELKVDADLTRLAQVFSNILINAAKYTPPGGRIALEVGQRQGQAVVTVTDNGIGIADADMPEIFKMFARVASLSNRSQGGQGIGLWLARGLIEMHGGSIDARSGGENRGSTFELRLPLIEPSAAVSPEVAVADETGASGEAPLRVLIVDDLRDGSDSLAMLLSGRGHTVQVAYDGREALRLAEAFRPEVVLLDLGMPGVDGYEVCRRIRATPWGGGMTVVAQSGWAQEDARQRSREAGFDHHLTKPIAPESLLALLRPQALGDNPSASERR